MQSSIKNLLKMQTGVMSTTTSMPSIFLYQRLKTVMKVLIHTIGHNYEIKKLENNFLYSKQHNLLNCNTR